MFNDDRPKRRNIYMRFALDWAGRALCKQDNRAVGCVITTEDMRVTLATGYNGPPKQLGNDACRNEKGNCGCLHAEANAIAMVDGRIPNKIMFVTMCPCETCATLIAQSNITKVFYYQDYRNKAGLERLQACGIDVIRINDLGCSRPYLV